MKKIAPYLFIISVAGIIFILSCKKEMPCEGCIANNKRPIAIAGPDQVITLPSDSILLDGSASNDPDGTISEWLWKKISGPALYYLINSSSSKTVVRNLVTGIYQFELKVIDDKGLTATDTMQVSVDNPSTSVYVAGYEYNGTYVSKKYWKNGVPTTLLADDDAFVSGIAVSGNDVYVSGCEKNGSKYVAKYWKNGNPINLTNGSYDAYTTAIAVVGSDVYVSGYEHDGQRHSAYDDDSNLYYYNYPVAKYWKNGISVSLSDTIRGSHARDIAVVDADVYVAGDEKGIVKYWKNGNPIPLPSNSGSGAGVIAMAISGNDVYVLGYDGNSITGRLIVKYWKNGNPVIFSDGSRPILVTDIAVSGGDVYVAGSEYNGTHDVGKYWKNGSPILLSGNIPVAYAIAVVGSDAYVSGYDHSGVSQNVHSRVAKCWKNGSAVALNDGSKWSYTIGIAVTH